MSTHKLAPVRWELGQILLPEHFKAMHASLLAELRLRAAVSGLPCYGVAELAWNEEALKRGQLAVRSLTAVLPSGTLVHVPGNAMLRELSLSAVGAPHVRVYLHRLGEPADAVGNPTYSQDPKTLKRELLSLRLSTQQALERSDESMQLALFERRVDGWGVNPSFCPPLLQLGPHPFLRDQRDWLEAKLIEFHKRLLDDLDDDFLRGDRLAGIRSCLLEVCQVRSLLAEIPTGIHLHPYPFFASLRRLYFAICNFNDQVPDRPVFAYLHDALGDCFGELFRSLEARLSQEATQANHVELQRRDGRFVIESWPPSLSEARHAYLLCSRNARQEQVSLEGIKLASPDRLELVHRAALRGVPFEPLAQPPADHPFVHGMDFYKLTLAEEWTYVQKARALAFYVTAPLEPKEIRVLLYWTEDRKPK